jgi:uncharacterized protein
MDSVSREFQIFAKPVGPACNLSCTYCYYLKNETPKKEEIPLIMSDAILGEYIKQHIEATTGNDVFFSWHGGEPTLAGIDFYKKVVDLQNHYNMNGKTILNGIQTNGTLLNDEWCRFLSENKFIVGISLDGPAEVHDLYRKTANLHPTHSKTLNGYQLLKKWNIPNEILCVVNAVNVNYPAEVYGYLKNIGARYITFLPLVERDDYSGNSVTDRSVLPDKFGAFLCTIFDEWVSNDIGIIKIQIFEEATRIAFGQDHTLCIFRETCGGVPVVERNGDFYSCDHYVSHSYLVGNILEKSLGELLDSPEQKQFEQDKLASLPGYCLKCNVRNMCNGECPKNRFMLSPDGEKGINYLCEGYKKFFNHCMFFVEEVERLWNAEKDSYN